MPGEVDLSRFAGRRPGRFGHDRGPITGESPPAGKNRQKRCRCGVGEEYARGMRGVSEGCEMSSREA